jgi:hypothetical protein
MWDELKNKSWCPVLLEKPYWGLPWPETGTGIAPPSMLPFFPRITPSLWSQGSIVLKYNVTFSTLLVWVMCGMVVFLPVQDPSRVVSYGPHCLAATDTDKAFETPGGLWQYACLMQGQRYCGSHFETDPWSPEVYSFAA